MVEVLHRAKFRHNLAVISNVIAIVCVWRVIMGRKPNDVDAQVLEVVQPFSNTLKVADAVPIRILKGPRIDFIKNCLSPPLALISVYVGDQKAKWQTMLRLDRCPSSNGCAHHSKAEKFA